MQDEGCAGDSCLGAPTAPSGRPPRKNMQRIATDGHRCGGIPCSCHRTDSAANRQYEDASLGRLENVTRWLWEDRWSGRVWVARSPYPLSAVRAIRPPTVLRSSWHSLATYMRGHVQQVGSAASTALARRPVGFYDDLPAIVRTIELLRRHPKWHRVEPFSAGSHRI
jgi:hypothetical protein